MSPRIERTALGGRLIRRPEGWVVYRGRSQVTESPSSRAQGASTSRGPTRPLRDWFLGSLAAERAVPLALHDRGVAEDGAPEWSHAWWAWLLADPRQTVRWRERQECRHSLTLGRPDGCRLCGGLGVVEAEVTRERYPLWAALRRLRASQRGRQHLLVLAAIAEGRPVPEEEELAALQAVRQRYRR